MDQNVCEEKYSNLRNYFRVNKSFCVIGDENGSPCTHDQCLFVKSNGRWFLRGILFRAFTFRNGSCGVGPFYPFIYHDIARNVKWIENIINK
jgi:hypothetical protein